MGETTGRVPPIKHMTFIMDGNRRWARSQRYSLREGYRSGAQKLKEVVSWGIPFGIQNFSFFAFGKDNWKRPQTEVDLLWQTLVQQVGEIEKHLKKEEVAFMALGDRDHWPKKARQSLETLEETTKHYTKARVALILDYSGQWDVEQAVDQHTQAVLENENNQSLPWQRFLYSERLPNPEILVRTGSEKRISNFYLYNLAYTELFFPECFWPEFSHQDFTAVLEEFARRGRRFGQ